jgi:hypothetical protein
MSRRSTRSRSKNGNDLKRFRLAKMTMENLFHLLFPALQDIVQVKDSNHKRRQVVGKLL